MRDVRWTRACACAGILAALTPYGAVRGVTAAGHQAARPARVISLVPAVTDMIVEIGGGSRLAALGSFDRPAEPLAQLPRVGGLLDPDVERILSLKPDLVIVYETQTDLRAQLERAGIAMFVYRHEGLRDVTSTIRALGTRLGREAAAASLAAAIDRDLQTIAARVRGRPRPKTLLVYERVPFTLRGIYASGGAGFSHDMLDVAGGANVLADVMKPAVQVTTETVLARAPEVIVELHYGDRERPPGWLPRERAVWNALSSVPAVQMDRVYLLAGDELVVPGPRVAAATERIARVLHPEGFR
jgi:iron complex transport system substrate-binding protein